MTKRKPLLMPVESWVDQQIRAAENRGAFDNLPGAGKPLEKVDTSDPAWWVKRKLVDENLTVALPPQLELRKEVKAVLAALPKMRTEPEVRRRLEALNERIRVVNRRTIAGPATDLGVLDVQTWVERWRSR